MIHAFRQLTHHLTTGKACRPRQGQHRRILWSCGWLLGAMLTLSGTTGAQEETLEEDEAESGAQAGQYVDLQPEFVLNYGLDGRLHYLRLEVTLMMTNAAAATEANHHAPALRHIVVMNVSKTPRADMQTTTGRQALRQRLLDDMQQLMTEETGQPLVQDILFSNLILQ
ncbi:MAG: flagellar basal body-associated FliL family protein [Natronospirillum sp.]